LYDIRKAARDLAIFSYLTHIMRDFEKDQKAGLNYFAESILRHAGITTREVRELAESGKVDGRLREVFRIYHATARRYQQKARAVVDSTLVQLEPRYQLSLELIFALYSQIFERINPATGTFGKSELNPTPEEVAEAVQLTIERFRPVERKNVSHGDSIR
jgi:phytoene/squalene synthetase